MLPFVFCAVPAARLILANTDIETEGRIFFPAYAARMHEHFRTRCRQPPIMRRFYLPVIHAPAILFETKHMKSMRRPAAMPCAAAWAQRPAWTHAQ
jgi:hypothetical protein